MELIDLFKQLAELEAQMCPDFTFAKEVLEVLLNVVQITF